MRVHPVVYFFVKGLSRLFLIAVFLGVPAAIYHLRVHGIGWGAREALAGALSSPQVEVRIGKLALDPFQGLLARDVSVSERRDGGIVLASVNQVAVSPNFAELMRRRLVVDRLSLRNADADIPLSRKPGSSRLGIEDIDAEIILLGDRLRLSRFEGVIERLRISLTAEVLRPLEFQLPRPAEGERDHESLAGFLDLWRSMEFPGDSPVLHLDLRVDAANPLASLEIPSLLLQCQLAKWRNASLSGLTLQAGWSGGILEIRRLEASDGSGRLQATGRLEDSLARASLISSLDPTPFLESAGVWKNGGIPWKILQPPRLEADLFWDTRAGLEGLRATGFLQAEAIRLGQSTFRDLSIGFAWEAGRFHARGIKLQAERGELQANLWIAPGDVRLQLHTTIPPTDLAPLADPKTREFLDRMQFAATPDIRLDVRGSAFDFACLSGNGHLQLGRTAMRGAWIDSAVADFEISDRCVTYRDFTIRTGQGKGTGSFAYDVGRQEVRLDNIRSTLVPKDVMLWIDPRIAQTISAYRFRSNPDLAVQGKVHMRLAAKNNLSISIQAPGGMDYDLLGKTLPFGPVTAKVQVLGNTVDARVSKAALYGGQARIDAKVSIDPANPVFEVATRLDRVDVASLTGLYFDYRETQGFLTGNYSFQARMKEEELMTGRGTLRIEDGNVFAIPTLGPLSAIIGKAVPGIAYNTARLATADFTVANRKIHSRNIEIIGKGFTMFGEGDIYFLTGGLDMDMRLNAQGVTGTVLFPMSKLFEYSSTGTIMAPDWRPKLMPKIPIPGLGRKDPAP